MQVLCYNLRMDEKLYTSKVYGDYERIVDLVVFKGRNELPHVDNAERCKLVLLCKGALSFELNGIPMEFKAPAAIYLSDRIVIMTPRPGKISNIIEVKIPHPRQRGGVEFLAMRRKLLEEFDLATALPEPEYNI